MTMLYFSPADLRAAATAAGDTSLSQIAARTGLGRSTICRLLNGERQPTLRTAQKLAKAYPAQQRSLAQTAA